MVFSGVQLMLLGVIGEYLGRMFLTVNQRPQAVVREVVCGEPSGRRRQDAAPAFEFVIEGVGHEPPGDDGRL